MIFFLFLVGSGSVFPLNGCEDPELYENETDPKQCLWLLRSLYGETLRSSRAVPVTSGPFLTSPLHHTINRSGDRYWKKWKTLRVNCFYWDGDGSLNPRARSINSPFKGPADQTAGHGHWAYGYQLLFLARCSVWRVDSASGPFQRGDEAEDRILSRSSKVNIWWMLLFRGGEIRDICTLYSKENFFFVGYQTAHNGETNRMFPLIAVN